MIYPAGKSPFVELAEHSARQETEIESLRQQLAEAKDENENLGRANLDNGAWFDQLKADYDKAIEQLAASQAREVKMREALAITQVILDGEGIYPKALKQVSEVLALPTGTSALNAIREQYKVTVDALHPDWYYTEDEWCAPDLDALAESLSEEFEYGDEILVFKSVDLGSETYQLVMDGKPKLITIAKPAQEIPAFLRKVEE